jgi:hypothetical protein
MAMCFGSLNHHQAKYQNMVLVHSVSVHIVCALTECTSTVLLTE